MNRLAALHALLALGLLALGCGESTDSGNQGLPIVGNHDGGDLDATAPALDGSAPGSQADGGVNPELDDSGVLTDADAVLDPDDSATPDSGPIPCSSPIADPICESEACVAIHGKTFAAIDERECGISPDGLVYCHWTVAFAAGVFQWHHSDVVESGEYSCNGLSISGTSVGPATFSGSYEPNTAILTWEGDEYVARN